MVLRGHTSHTTLTVSVTPASLAVALDDGQVWTWDRGGRLYAAVVGESTCRRALGGTVIETRRIGGRRHRRRLSAPEADTLLDTSAALATATASHLGSPAWTWDQPPDADAVAESRHLLSRCAAFDAAGARVDEAGFAAAYGPIGVLPPDQYLSLVVQATEGCSVGTCTFCNLYHASYRVKTPDEFRAHLGRVLAFLGESRLLRSRGIFLGAANALSVPQPRLVALFDALAEEVDARRHGVCAFVDGFTGEMKRAADYAALRERGLRRVYVGLESGHDPLLAFVRKPATTAQVVATVQALKTAGVHVGIMVMTGLGGERYAAAHESDTASVLSAMELGPGDVLYFSELEAASGTPYTRLADDTGIVPLDAEGCARQRDRIQQAVRYSSAPPMVSSYDVGGFVW